MKKIIIAVLVLFSVLYTSGLKGQDSCGCFIDFFLAEKIYFSGENKENSIKYYRKALIDRYIAAPSVYYNTFWKSYQLDSFDFCNELQNVFIHQDMTYQDYKGFMLAFPKFDYKIDSTDFEALTQNSSKYNLDSILILDLEYMVKRDQLLRENESWENNSSMTMSKISEMNCLWLKEIFEMNGGAIPSIDKIGYDGLDNIQLLLLHLDMEHIIDLWQYLVKSIKHHKYFIAEDIIYQIERNVISSPYLVQLKGGDLIKVYGNKKISNSDFYYQNYGGIDMFDVEQKQGYWWAFNPNMDIDNVNKVRKALCLDSLKDYIERKARISKLSDEEFLKRALKHEPEKPKDKG